MRSSSESGIESCLFRIIDPSNAHENVSSANTRPACRLRKGDSPLPWPSLRSRRTAMREVAASRDGLPRGAAVETPVDLSLAVAAKLPGDRTLARLAVRADQL